MINTESGQNAEMLKLSFDVIHMSSLHSTVFAAADGWAAVLHSLVFKLCSFTSFVGLTLRVLLAFFASFLLHIYSTDCVCREEASSLSLSSPDAAR